MTTSFDDNFYVAAFERFITKFECAIARIKHNGQILYDRYDYNILHLGQQGSSYVWEIRALDNRIHPFMVLLNGRRSHNHEANADVDRMFGFQNGTMSILMQGFNRHIHYKDCWQGDAWPLSAAFHVGRYLYTKNFGDVGLVYTIPEILLRGTYKYV